jgi:hypothetical protein
MNRTKVKGKSSRSDCSSSNQLPLAASSNAPFQPQAQQQPLGNIASFIRGNKNSVPDPQVSALAMAAAANPQLAMMNAAAAASFFNPAMMGFHPMLGMNPVMSATLFNPGMLASQAAALGLHQQQQLQQLQQQLQAATNPNGNNVPTKTTTAVAAVTPKPPAITGNSSDQSGGGEPTFTAEV